MTNNIAINGKFLLRRVTGVDRVAHEISKRLSSSRTIQPKNKVGQITGNLWEQFVLPTKIKQDEILWSPANAGPWFVKNQVLTIHDASVFDHPEWFKLSFAAWTRLSWKILAKRVKAIITVSNFSQERLIHHLQIPSEKIHVIYNGVGKPFEPQTAKQIEIVKEKYGIKKPYFLFVGTNEPRKNITMLLKVWKQLNLKSHKLFLTGTNGNIFSSVGHAFSVTYITDENLPALYSGATAFISPSFYEGFGLTNLEAMACGTPVIASNISAFQETLGNSAIFIDPHNSIEISNAMQNIIEEPNLANTYRDRGFQLAQKFTWDESARKTQSLLESIQ